MTDLDEVTTDRLILRRMEAEDWAAQRRLDGDSRMMATLGGLRPPDRPSPGHLSSAFSPWRARP